MNYLLLLIGFIILIKGADTFVDSASAIARKFKIPPIVIGMTIVAIGTSAPEMAVSVTSALKGLNDMSIANVVGSNVFNLLMVLGISSLFNKLKINKFSDVLTMIIASLLLFVLTVDGTLCRIDGLILLASFGLFIYDMIKETKNNTIVEEIQSNKYPFWLTIIFGLLGLGAIILGGNLVVNNASAIALQLGMSEKLVGLTIVAVGTSLPELVTSVVATRKGELDIAIGNVLGSNIFNILLILGISSLLSPMIVSSIVDTIFMCVIGFAFALMTHKTKTLVKTTGIVMMIVYVLYILSTIL